MNTFIEQILLAFGGFAFHLLKMWYAASNRNETFITKRLGIWVAMNIVASILLIYVGKNLPPDLIVMSPLTCIIIGAFGSSMLSGFINVKKPKDVGIDDLDKDAPPKP